MLRTPLVLVHGNPESAAIWGPLIGELDRADAVVLSPPGFGVPVPRGFDSSATTYRDWLASQLELFPLRSTWSVTTGAEFTSRRWP